MTVEKVIVPREGAGYNLLQLDLGQVNGLPWQPYRARPIASWIYCDQRRPAGSERLIRAVEALGGQLTLAGYRYVMRKDVSVRLLSRWPEAKKKG